MTLSASHGGELEVQAVTTAAVHRDVVQVGGGIMGGLWVDLGWCGGGEGVRVKSFYQGYG